MQLVRSGVQPSDADEGLQLSKAIQEIAGIRAVRTVLDHALQAVGTRGSGERPDFNPWSFNRRENRLEWRGDGSELEYYRDVIRDDRWLGSGSGQADPKAMAYVRALRELNDPYVTESLNNAIKAVKSGQAPKHREPSGLLSDTEFIRTLRVAAKAWI